MRNVLKAAFVIAMFIVLGLLMRLSTQMYAVDSPQPFVEAPE